MIEGIGSDVIWALLFIFIFAIIFTYYQRYVRKERIKRDQNLTPDASPLEDMDNENNVLNGTQRPSNFRRYYQDQQCPICLNNSTYPVETNCGHMFCSKCLLSYFKMGSWGLSAMSCPVCRQKVTLIIPCFPTTTQRGETEVSHLQERQNYTDEINTYNRRFSDTPRSVREYIRDMPVLLRHAVTEFFSPSGLMIIFRLRMLLCFVSGFLYLVSPFDLIPEALFGIFGFIDDFIVVLLVAIYASVTYRQVLSHRGDDSTFPSPSGSDDTPSASRNYLDRNNLLDIIRDRERGVGIGDQFNDYLFGNPSINYYGGHGSATPGAFTWSQLLGSAGLMTNPASSTNGILRNTLNWAWRNIGSRRLGGTSRNEPSGSEFTGNYRTPTQIRNSSRRTRNDSPLQIREVDNSDDSPANNTRSSVARRLS